MNKELFEEKIDAGECPMDCGGNLKQEWDEHGQGHMELVRTYCTTCGWED